MIIQRNRLQKKTSRRGLNVDKNTLENQKKPWPLVTTPSMPLRKRRSIIPVRSRVLTAIGKATILATAPSQKTSVGLGNLRAGD